jgi:hypothetical protein
LKLTSFAGVLFFLPQNRKQRERERREKMGKATWTKNRKKRIEKGKNFPHLEEDDLRDAPAYYKRNCIVQTGKSHITLSL